MLKFANVDHETLLEHGCIYEVIERSYLGSENVFKFGVYITPNHSRLHSITEKDLRFTIGFIDYYIERELKNLGIEY